MTGRIGYVNKVFMLLNFKKMHGLGNDFVIFDGRENKLQLATEQIRYIADRKRGVGCDQIGILRHSKNWQELTHLEMYNSTGGVVEACGNMTRCVADILMTEDGTDNVVIETLNGSLNCWKEQNGQIRVEMGVPKLGWQEIPLSTETNSLTLPLEGNPVAVNMGNPHCVFFTNASGWQATYGSVHDWSEDVLNELGARFENDPLFPKKTNVEFVEVLSPNHVRMRVYERGVGITDACGSGACATAVAAIRRGLTERKMIVTLDGGDLILEWPSDDAPVHMTGPVTYVFDGTLEL